MAASAAPPADPSPGPPMRVLFLASPVASHFAPMIPLAWALRARGHEVMVAGQPDITGPARAAGLCAATIGDTFAVSDLMTSAVPDGRRPIEVLGRPDDKVLGRSALVWIMHARYTVPAYLRLARAWRPHLIVSDPMEFGALIVAAVLGIPAVHHRWGIDSISAPAWRPASRTLAGTCARLGLDRLPGPALVLDPCPADMQAPGAPASSPIRYVPHNGTGGVPSWALERPAGRRVCVCFGRLTPGLNGLPLLKRVAAALADLPDTEVLLAVDAGYGEALGRLPASTRLVGNVPLSLFLASCDLVVHHGGSGTGMTATALGRPQLVVPGLQDQFAFADRIAACGAGISVDDAARQNDAAALREAADAVLARPSFGQCASQLRDDIAAMPTPAAVVPGLEQLAGRR
jgi:UDP:flavonoid glycosyltransferase YjiC (YdhE family)